MNNIFTLVKVMLKGESSLNLLNDKDSKTKSILKIIGFIALLALAGFSFSTNIIRLYEPLKAVGSESAIIKMILTMTSMLILFFSVIYIMSSFYFSKDVERALYLPVRPGEILAAKFIVNYIYQLGTVGFISAPMFIAFGIVDKQPALFYLKALLTMLILPLVPLSIVSVLVMLLMRFSKFFRNKDAFNIISGVLGIVMAIGINIFINTGNTQGGIDINSPILKSDLMVMNIISPGISVIGVKILSNLKVFLPAFIIVVLFSLIAISIFYLIGNKIYLDGVQGLSETSSKREKLTESKLKNSTKSNSPLKALVSKELKTMLRTPAYLMNLILPQFIAFFFSVAYGIFTFFKYAKNININEVLKFLATLKEPTIMLVMACVVIFFSSVSPIAATAFTREGNNFNTMKALPVSPETLINSKLLPSLIVTAPMILLILSTTIILKGSIFYILMGTLLGLLASVTIFNIALTVDASNPNLSWENETKAVKQGFNSFVQMLIVIAMIALLVFLTYFISIGDPLYLMVTIPLFIGLVVASYMILIKKAKEAIYNRD